MSLVNHTVQIVQAFLTRNEIATQGVPGLILDVHRALSGLAAPGGEVVPVVAPVIEVQRETRPMVIRNNGTEKRQPAVPIDQAVSEDEVVCLLCGQRVKTLRGHLTRSHGMESGEYLQIFGLDKNFPLVAPSYSERRRKLAQDSGLSEKLRAGRRKKLDAIAAQKSAATTG